MTKMRTLTVPEDWVEYAREQERRFRSFTRNPAKMIALALKSHQTVIRCWYRGQRIPSLERQIEIMELLNKAFTTLTDNDEKLMKAGLKEATNDNKTGWIDAFRKIFI